MSSWFSPPKASRGDEVRLVVSTMRMDLMGLKREELIEGIDLGGEATYPDHAHA